MLNLDNKLFCPNDTFRDAVIDILCSGLFVQARTPLREVYNKMADNLNCVGADLIYPMSAGMLNQEIDSARISRDSKIYAGHDLPVWLGNPFGARHLMILSQDPRRNDNEMNGKEIGLSTPFGVHSLDWRSSYGLLVALADNLIKSLEERGKSLSVYFTDVYKLRGVDPLKGQGGEKSKTDKPNKERYIDILKREIGLFQPDVILTLGSEADIILQKIGINNTVGVPHPSGSANGKWGKVLKEWGKELKGKPCTDQNKILYICEKLLPELSK